MKIITCSLVKCEKLMLIGQAMGSCPIVLASGARLGANGFCKKMANNMVNEADK